MVEGSECRLVNKSFIQIKKKKKKKYNNLSNDHKEQM